MGGGNNLNSTISRLSAASNPYTMISTSDINVNLSYQTYTVTITTTSNGSISINYNGNTYTSGSFTVLAESVITIITTANSGYELDSLTANGTIISNVYTVTSNTTISATFIATEVVALSFSGNYKFIDFYVSGSSWCYSISGNSLDSYIIPVRIAPSILSVGVWDYSYNNLTSNYSKCVITIGSYTFTSTSIYSSSATNTTNFFQFTDSTVSLLYNSCYSNVYFDVACYFYTNS